MSKRPYIVFSLCFLAGCLHGESKIRYPTRPKDTPYFYNETAITEINPNARISLRRARHETDIEFVTVLVKQVPPDITIGDYAAGLFDYWKIGRNTEGKGVLLLFVENTHTLKIEVSYDLEGVFPDAFCSSFQPTIKSYFAGSYFGDVFCNLVENMKRHVLLGPKDTGPLLRTPVTDPKLLRSSQAFLSGGGGIIDNELALEPGNIPYRWLATCMRNRFPAPGPNSHHYKVLSSLLPGHTDVLYHHSIHCWHYTMEHQKAIRLIRKIKQERLRWKLRFNFEKDFREQIAVDRSLLWKAWHYVDIFWIDMTALCIMIPCFLLALGFAFKLLLHLFTIPRTEIKDTLPIPIRST